MPIYIEPETKRELEKAGAPYPAKPIPYEDLARQLIASNQTLVPFLGAGASLKFAERGQAPEVEELPGEIVQKVCKEAGVTEGSASWKFLEVAAQIAWKMEQYAKAQPAAASKPNLPGIGAVSSAELAELFARRAAFDCFEKPARTLRQILTKTETDALIGTLRCAAAFTGVGDTAPPLLAAASYYTYMRKQGDPGPLEILQQVFENVKDPTLTHRLIARVAKHHLESGKDKGVGEDYLIITTNYDDLIEKALDAAGATYLTLTVTKKERIVHARASKGMQQYLGLDDRRFAEFQLKLSPAPPKDVDHFSRPNAMKPLVIVYKIHGSLHPGQDSIILSDEDYVTFIQRSSQAEGMIPSPVVNLLDGKGFLMLGYSFSDWNIRALYKRLLEFEAQHRTDWAVLLHYDPFENGFFEYKGINVLRTTLDRFAQQIWNAATANNLADGEL